MIAYLPGVAFSLVAAVLALALWLRWRDERFRPRLARTFRDRSGRLWRADVTAAVLRRVQDECNVELLELVAPREPEQFGRLIARLQSEPMLLVDVIYCVVEEQCIARGVSDIDFGRGLAGDSLEEAFEALLAGVIDFFPHRRDRWRMRFLLTQTWRAAAKTRVRIDRTLRHRIPEILRQTAQPSTTYGPPSGGAQGSQGSTPPA